MAKKQTVEKLGEIYIEVKSKQDTFEKELNALKKKVDKDSKEMSNVFSNNFSKILGAVGGIIALKKAWDFTKEVKKIAADAAETRSKFSVIFGSIQKDAEATADKFAKSFGLAGATARQLLGNTGELLVGFGFTEQKTLDLSEKINALAQDLVSFSNYEGGAIGASRALTSAMMGETEAAKGLGKVVNQESAEFKALFAQHKAVAGVTETQAKALAVLDLLYNQSTKAVGDYQRTKGSLVNTERRLNEQFKDLEETLGKEITPIFASMMQLMEDFGKSTGEAGTTISIFGAILRAAAVPAVILATAIKLVGNTLGLLGAAIAKLVTLKFEQAWKILGNDINIKDLEAMTRAVNALTSSTKDMQSASTGKGKSGGKPLLGDIDKQMKDLDLFLAKHEALNDLTLKDLETAKGKYQKMLSQTKEVEKQISLYGKIAAINDEIIKKKNILLDIDAESSKLRGKSPEQIMQDIVNPKNLDREDYRSKARREREEKTKVLEDLDKLQRELALSSIDDVYTADIAAAYDEYNEKVQIYNDLDARRLGLEKEFADARFLLESDLNEKIRKILIERETALTEMRLSAMSELISSVQSLAGFFDQAGTSFVSKLAQAMQIAIKIAETINTMNERDTFSNILKIGASAISMIPLLFSHGGSAMNGHKIPKFASGGSMMVPYNGMSGDSYPILVKGGERVDVTPAHQVGNSDVVKGLGRVEKMLKGINWNLMTGSMEGRKIQLVWNNQIIAEGVLSYQNDLTKRGKNVSEI